MGRGVTQRPQHETNSDATVTSTSSTAMQLVDHSMASPSALLKARNQASTSHYLASATAPKAPKNDSTLWFPFEHSETRKSPSVGSSSMRHLDAFDRTRKSPAISPSCRYFPPSAIDKTDIFSPYASTLASESVSTHRPTSSSSASSSAASVSFPSLGDAYAGGLHHHSLLHTSPPTSYHHQSPVAAAHYHPHGGSSVGHALHSPVNSFPMAQNIPYDTAAAGNARCALPSPTIFPPTPPPSAPWNPWAGF